MQFQIQHALICSVPEVRISRFCHPAEVKDQREIRQCGREEGRGRFGYSADLWRKKHLQVIFSRPFRSQAHTLCKSLMQTFTDSLSPSRLPQSTASSDKKSTPTSAWLCLSNITFDSQNFPPMHSRCTDYTEDLGGGGAGSGVRTHVSVILKAPSIMKEKKLLPYFPSPVKDTLYTSMYSCLAQPPTCNCL